MDGDTQARKLKGGRGGHRTLGETVSSIRQRRLFRVAIAYAVGAWLAVQVVATVAPAFDLPPWTLRAVILLALAGFVATAAFVAFAGPDDVRSSNATERRRRLAMAISAVLVLLAGAGALLYSQRAALFGQTISVAVLPFADLSPARDKAYFAEGVAEEILSALASEKDIKVLGRASARQIERNSDPKAVRASLGVTHLLEGSTRTSGDQLRVNVRLLDTEDGSKLWEEEYQGRLADVFTVQDKIAATVVQRLRGTFLSAAVRETEPTSIDAYQAYLAARALMRDPKEESLTQARRIGQQLVETHPDYALGHALYAHATWLLADDPYSYGTIPADKARTIAVQHAREAIRRAPDQADGYAALGLALGPPGSLGPLHKAIELDPSRSSLRSNLGIDLNLLGRNDEAFEQYRMSVEIDPLSAPINNRFISALASSGRRAEAFRAIDAFVRRGGGKAHSWRFRANVHAELGDISAAIAARRRAIALDPQLPYQHEWLALSYNLLGFDEQSAHYASNLTRYQQLFLADDRGMLKTEVLKAGAKAWSANGLDVAIFSLARARDWSAIARFYDARPNDRRDLCVMLPWFTPFIEIALAKQGRRAQAVAIHACYQKRLSAQLAMRYRSADHYAGELEMWQASMFAIRNDPRAFDWLNRAFAKGWVGQYSSANLADWPQFDSLRGDSRYAALQRRIDEKIAKERAEVLAGR